jgi:hypothetical protein
VNLIVGFVRLVIALFLVRIVFRFIAAVIEGLREPQRERARSVDMVRDRVCNTFLPRERAITEIVNGCEMHFCSAACRDRARVLAPGS